MRGLRFLLVDPAYPATYRQDFLHPRLLGQVAFAGLKLKPRLFTEKTYDIRVGARRHSGRSRLSVEGCLRQHVQLKPGTLPTH
jgi:hypothetical protein